LKQGRRRTIANKAIKNKISTAHKKAVKTIGSNDKEAAQKALSDFYKIIDKAGKKNIFHKNKIARRKSRLASKLNAMK
ncbi:30S ribosomal protein S20, partial [Spirochaetota bacterium]